MVPLVPTEPTPTVRVFVQYVPRDVLHAPTPTIVPRV